MRPLCQRCSSQDPDITDDAAGALCVFGPVLIDGVDETIDSTLLPISPTGRYVVRLCAEVTGSGGRPVHWANTQRCHGSATDTRAFCIPKPQPFPGHLIGQRSRFKTARTPGRSPGFLQILKLNSESSLRLLDLDLDIDTCRQVKTLKRIDSLG
jgi:hypothetical protein